MRKTLLFIFVLSLGLAVFGQQRAMVDKSLREIAVPKQKAVKGIESTENTAVPGQIQKSIMAEDAIGDTWYDIQTNQSMQTRMYLHSDGTLGGVWTFGPDGNPSGPDRGTGYNYFDGNNWGPYPTIAIENAAQAGWPSYTTFGENGEAYTCHDYYEGTILGTRTQRGTGTWNLVIQPGPTNAEDISFPRITTTGPDRDIIHILSTTWVPYNGQDHALLYARTTDAGTTWEVENELFSELGTDYTLDLGGDTYDWAEPKGDLLAFLVGDNWMDLALMKSYDGGDTWSKTVIWECPYPLNPPNTVTDTFYCPDGAHHLAIDNSGKVHVVFGLTRALDDGAGPSYFPGVDGVVYWNEDRPVFSDDINALSPYGDVGSELVEDFNLIGWSQDLNNNGTIDILDEWGYYNVGLSSQPQIVIDDQNRIFVVYASVTESFDNGTASYRHLWARASTNGGLFWGDFTDLNEGLLYIFDECVYPSASPTSDDNIYFSYQQDNTPGASDNGISADENTYRARSVDKSTLISGIRENRSLINEGNVSQNYPNPFTGTTKVYVTLDEPAILSLEVTNMVGQLVYQLPEAKYPAGKSEMVISAENFTSGVYFYTVKNGSYSVTRKMIVE